MRMYLERLGDAGYVTFKLARTNNRGDGNSIYILDLFSVVFYILTKPLMSFFLIYISCHDLPCEF